MKSLSNIVKWNYINFDGEEKHIVDSDKSDKMPKNISQGFIAGIHIATPQEIADNFLHMQEENGQETIMNGVSALNQEKKMEEERKRIAKKADSLLSDAKVKAQALVDEAMQQVDEIKNQAYEDGKQEGYEAGILESKETLLEKEQELEEKKIELQNRQSALEEQFLEKEQKLEPLFAELTGSLIEKITGIVVEDKKDIILYLIQNGIEMVGKSKEFRIHISSEDMEFVKTKKEMLQQELQEEAILEIIEDLALEKNQCIIETNTKMIDSSLDIQLRNLLENLRILSIS
ncbi:MAG: FliH/SctL family protein [Acetivibrio sp.]